MLLQQRDSIGRQEVAVTLCTVDERRRVSSRKTAGSSIENYKSTKDEPSGAIPTRPQRTESVCRKRMLRASLTPRHPPPQGGGEHGMQRQHPQTALQREVAERHNSRISPKTKASQGDGQGVFISLLKFPKCPEHLATTCPLCLVLSFQFLRHWKHLLKRA